MLRRVLVDRVQIDLVHQHMRAHAAGEIRRFPAAPHPESARSLGLCRLVSTISFVFGVIARANFRGIERVAVLFGRAKRFTLRPGISAAETISS